MDKLSEKEQIDKLKEVALSSSNLELIKKVIDVLAIYGEDAILAITEIVNKSVFYDIKDYGLDIIKKIKSKGGHL
jgi:hypothetical protein